MLAFFSLLLTITSANQNILDSKKTEKASAAVNEVGAFVIGRLCHSPTNDTICCIEKYSLQSLTEAYPSVYPEDLYTRDISHPDDRYNGVPDPQGRPRTFWTCEIPSRWTPNVMEPYAVTSWYRPQYPSGIFVADERKIVSPRCANRNVELECQYC